MTDDIACLEKLHAAQPAEGYAAVYLEAQGRPNSIRRHVDVFERYAEYVPAGSRVLDWGCCHAPDSCLLRNRLGEDVDLYGCDFFPPEMFGTFHAYAGLQYTELDGPGRLPYDDGFFDVVIASGVLEHTANDSIALQELHRVIRDEGTVVFTFLPNRLSYTEILGNALRMPNTHLRRYGRGEARDLLLHHGFRPVLMAYHQMIPGQRMSDRLGDTWRWNRYLERAWPLNRLATNHMLVATRRVSM